MPQKYLIKTKRLGLRTWKGSDLKSFAKMNADPKVMHYFPNLLTEAQSKAYFDRINQHYEQHGFTVYAVDKLDINQFIGYIGFACPRFESFFTPCVEIGWRLDARVWNQGLATEGGLACLDYGFNNLNFDAIHSFTAVLNQTSERIMQKIGLKKIGKFDHPFLEDDDPLKPHVLYMTKK